MQARCQYCSLKYCNGDFSHLGGDLESGARTQGIAGHLALKTAGLMAAATADDPLLKRFSQKRLEADRTCRRGKKEPLMGNLRRITWTQCVKESRSGSSRAL